MARNNKPRTLGSEKILAQRIKRERKARDWSPAELAKEMTDVGCSMATSAIYRIEEGTRKISVDELVALTTVFDATMDELLTPMDELDDAQAMKLIEHWDQARASLNEAVAFMLGLSAELFGLLVERGEAGRDIFDYVLGHMSGPAAPIPPARPASLKLKNGTEVRFDTEALIDAEVVFTEQVIDVAARAVRVYFGMPELDGDGEEHGER